MRYSEKIVDYRKTEGIVEFWISGLKSYDRALLVGMRTIWEKKRKKEKKRFSECILVFPNSTTEIRRASISVLVGVMGVCELNRLSPGTCTMVSKV